MRVQRVVVQRVQRVGSATRKRRKLALQHRQAESATAETPEAHSASAWPPQHVSVPTNIALITSAAATQLVYCYAVAWHAASVQDNFGLLRTATPHSRAAFASRATSSDCKIARVQRCKIQMAKRTRMRTLASRALEQIPRTARIASASALNCARPARDSLLTLLGLRARDDVMATSVHSPTAPLVCARARLKSPVPAPSPFRAFSSLLNLLPAPFHARAAEWPEFD